MILVLAAQFFGSSMNVMTQILERTGNDGKGYDPFQVPLHTRYLASIRPS
jgi:hypothetical protein